MKLDELFGDVNDRTADKLASDFPVLDDAKKERLYAMSKRKLNDNNEPERNRIEVSGVERKRGRRGLAAFGAAAAAVLAVAGIGGSTLLISKNGKTPGAEVTGSAYETVEATEPTEEIAATEAVEDYCTIANELADAYAEFFSDLYGGTLEVDESKVVAKKISVGADGSELTREFYRVTDPDYTSLEDVWERCYKILDKEYGDRLIEHSNLCKEEDVSEATFMYEGEDGLYIEKGVHDSNFGQMKFAEPPTITKEDDGTIICVLSENVKTENGGFVRTSTLHIAQTDAGWRVVLAEEEIKNND